MRFGMANRASRALATHPACMCDVLDRICGVGSDSVRPFFSTLRQLAGWATNIAASHHHRDTSDVDSATGGSPTSSEPRMPDDSPVVTAAIAIGALLNYYRRLGSHYVAAGVPPPTNVPVDVVLDTLQAASGTVGGAAKGAIARRLLERGVEDLGEFVLPLAFACIVTNAREIQRQWEEIVLFQDSPRLSSASGEQRDDGGSGGSRAVPHAHLPLDVALRLIAKLAELIPTSNETADLLSSLPHPTHLLVVMDRVAWLDELASTTMVENVDEVHDLNENFQPLVSSSWLERTDKVLKNRGKGIKWLRSPQAIAAAGNPTAVAKHVRWCRAAHRCIQAHQASLPIIASFALVADHPQANHFFQSLALASQHRLAEKAMSAVAIYDTARFILNPRVARLDRITVRMLLRVAELDPEFIPQLGTFEPRSAYS
jgi:hypothetical protein